MHLFWLVALKPYLRCIDMARRNILTTLSGQKIGLENGGPLILNLRNGNQVVIDDAGIFKVTAAGVSTPIGGGRTVIPITTSRVLTSADKNAILVSVSSSAIVLTTVAGSADVFDCIGFQGGTGVVSFAQGAGTTVANASGTFGAGTSIGLISTGADTYDVLTGAGQSAITSTVASGAAVALTTATTVNVTSVTLTPGKWNVSAMVDFSLAAASTTLMQSGPSVVSATLPTQPGGAGLGTDGLAGMPLILTTNTSVFQQSSGTEVIVTVDTLLYLTARATFSAGGVTAYGSIFARRQ